MHTQDVAILEDETVVGKEAKEGNKGKRKLEMEVAWRRWTKKNAEDIRVLSSGNKDSNKDSKLLKYKDSSLLKLATRDTSSLNKLGTMQNKYARLVKLD